ncbi:MAG: DUF4876 domain-containing protein [Bacteroidales bacterium]|nr:DUF4876 domain-containing protein [Bacteroidales bacterium]
MTYLRYLLFAWALIFVAACTDDEVSDYNTYRVSVTLINPLTGNAVPDAEVSFTSSMGNCWKSVSDSSGVAAFRLPAGLYRLSSSAAYVNSDSTHYFLNASTENLVVNAGHCVHGATSVTLTYTASRQGSLIIKELYNGGCQKDDGSGVYQYDKYCTLYNNGQTPLTLTHLALGMVAPYNAQSNAGSNYNEYGRLNYESEGFIPAIQAIWYYPDSLVLQGNEEITIVLNGAIDHTVSYKNSVNLGKAEYYCTYDPTVFTSTSYYPVPSTLIPSSHYWKAVFYGAGTAWPVSTTSPALFIWQSPDSISPQEYANSDTNLFYSGGTQTPTYACRKIPTDWVLDAIEVFTTTSISNRKRMTDNLDAGAVYFTNQQGYTLYRCVDVEATLAVEGNADKLVYGLPSTPDASDGVVTTDPSGIDAEASLANGAVIIYQDTNNSTNDFFERYQSALRD